MENKSFLQFILREGLRQDSLVHATASQLGTKSSLYMVFAAFIFTAEASFASMGAASGLRLPRWPLLASLLLVLVAIGALLWSNRLVTYRMPPILSELRAQSKMFFSLSDIKRLPEDEQMHKFEEKFLNSVTRSVAENFQANKKITGSLTLASWLIGISLSCLFFSLAWSSGEYLLHAFGGH